MRVAVVGGGISGLVSCWQLRNDCDVTLFEAGDYLGGHTDTHELTTADGKVAVDSGFIVFNEANYRYFLEFINELGVAHQPSDMSFGVYNPDSGNYYNATDLAGLFLRKRNLLSPSYLKLWREVLRFYRESPSLLDESDELTLEDYLDRGGYSQRFRDEHLYPMAAALWSANSAMVPQFPAKYLVAFMANHNMLQVDNRPEWRTIKGGSNQYVKASAARLGDRVRLNCPVKSIRRNQDSVSIVTEAATEQFDYVIICCHSDQALKLLDQPTEEEARVLGQIEYQYNSMALHTDTSLLPPDQRGWAAWNVLNRSEVRESGCQVTYYMNKLQQLSCEQHFLVSLNCDTLIDQSKILVRRDYAHPIYTRESVAAQQHKHLIQGAKRCFYAGAYWGWGFHEDGVRSAREAVKALREKLSQQSVASSGVPADVA